MSPYKCHAVLPSADALEVFLMRLFLRRYVTYCARRRRFAAINGAARLYREIRAMQRPYMLSYIPSYPSWRQRPTLKSDRIGCARGVCCVCSARTQGADRAGLRLLAT